MRRQGYGAMEADGKVPKGTADLRVSEMQAVRDFVAAHTIDTGKVLFPLVLEFRTAAVRKVYMNEELGRMHNPDNQTIPSRIKIPE